jgi:hypothetical protein
MSTCADRDAFLRKANASQNSPYFAQNVLIEMTEMTGLRMKMKVIIRPCTSPPTVDISMSSRRV